MSEASYQRDRVPERSGLRVMQVVRNGQKVPLYISFRDAEEIAGIQKLVRTEAARLERKDARVIG